MKYVVAGLLAAAAAFLLAPRLLHRDEPPAPAAADGPLGDDPVAWGRRFPAQFEAWRLPASVDERWRERHGHAFSVRDQEESAPDADPRWSRILAGAPRLRPLPGACLRCHASGAPEAPYWEARRRPIGCADCHDPKTVALRRPRTELCTECHREYYLDGAAAAFPKGTRVEDIEAIYQASGQSDWRHAETGAVVRRAQHPQFELWSQGLHARAGVSCIECHMPYVRRGAVRIADHRCASPLTACEACHRFDAAAELKKVQAGTQALLSRAEDALVALIDDIGAAQAAGAPAARLAPALALQTRAQWRIDFVASDRSKGFHAPQEAARILSEAIDYARQGQVAVRTVQ